jgi:hypothetical protein
MGFPFVDKIILSSPYDISAGLLNYLLKVVARIGKAPSPFLGGT